MKQYKTLLLSLLVATSLITVQAADTDAEMAAAQAVSSDIDTSALKDVITSEDAVAPSITADATEADLTEDDDMPITLFHDNETQEDEASALLDAQEALIETQEMTSATQEITIESLQETITILQKQVDLLTAENKLITTENQLLKMKDKALKEALETQLASNELLQEQLFNTTQQKMHVSLLTKIKNKVAALFGNMSA